MVLCGFFWGLCFQKIEGLELFDLMLLMAASLGLPMAAPLFLGIFFKKTPPWAGWSTMLAGFIPATILGLLFQFDVVVQFFWQNQEMTSADLIAMICRASDLSPREIGDLKIIITTGVVTVVCCGWFFMSMLFYRKDKTAYVEQVDRFFKDMETPIQTEEHELGVYDNEARQSGVLGNLCLVYGIFILLLVLIPNEPSGRLIILCCGLVVIGISALLKHLATRSRKKSLMEK